MLAPTPLSTATWPRSADKRDLQQIVWAQMKTVAKQAALIKDYQSVLEEAQEIPPAKGTGTASGTPAITLNVTGVTGSIALGSIVTGHGMQSGTMVVAQTSGPPGGNGHYTISVPSTSSAAALTFKPGGGDSKWPTTDDADELMLIAQDQTALIRMQTAILQTYQTLLNDSQTVPPPP